MQPLGHGSRHHDIRVEASTHRLKPARKVYGVAEYSAFVMSPGGDHASDDAPVMQTYTKRQRSFTGADTSVTPRVKLLNQLLGTVECIRGVLLAGCGKAKYDHDPIADELVDGATVFRDHRDDAVPEVR